MTTPDWLAHVNWAAIKAHEDKWRDLPTVQVSYAPKTSTSVKKNK